MLGVLRFLKISKWQSERLKGHQKHSTRPQGQGGFRSMEKSVQMACAPIVHRFLGAEDWFGRSICGPPAASCPPQAFTAGLSVLRRLRRWLPVVRRQQKHRTPKHEAPETDANRVRGCEAQSHLSHFTLVWPCIGQQCAKDQRSSRSSSRETPTVQLCKIPATIPMLP